MDDMESTIFEIKDNSKKAENTESILRKLPDLIMIKRI
jgi:hypothetical protein